jgi:large subunit ribosomal protein L23
MKNPHDVLIRPVYTEKSVGLASAGRYTFVVDPAATKVEIRQAVENAFNVRVRNVNTLNRPGKRKRNRKQWRKFGKRADTKRAIVTLHEGDTIELFEV